MYISVDLTHSLFFPMPCQSRVPHVTVLTLTLPSLFHITLPTISSPPQLPVFHYPCNHHHHTTNIPQQPGKIHASPRTHEARPGFHSNTANTGTPHHVTTRFSGTPPLLRFPCASLRLPWGFPGASLATTLRWHGPRLLHATFFLPFSGLFWLFWPHHSVVVYHSVMV